MPIWRPPEGSWVTLAWLWDRFGVTSDHFGSFWVHVGSLWDHLGPLRGHSEAPVTGHSKMTGHFSATLDYFGSHWVALSQQLWSQDLSRKEEPSPQILIQPVPLDTSVPSTARPSASELSARSAGLIV